MPSIQTMANIPAVLKEKEDLYEFLKDDSEIVDSNGFPVEYNEYNDTEVIHITDSNGFVENITLVGKKSVKDDLPFVVTDTNGFPF